jgi:hypothetical protein
MKVAWDASELFGVDYEVSDLQTMTRGDVAVLLSQMMNATPISGYRVNYLAGDGSYVRQYASETYGWTKFRLFTYTGVVVETKYGKLNGAGGTFDSKNFDARLETTVSGEKQGLQVKLDALSELEIAQALGKEYTVTLRLSEQWYTYTGNDLNPRANGESIVTKTYGAPALTPNNEPTYVSWKADGIYDATGTTLLVKWENVADSPALTTYINWNGTDVGAMSLYAGDVQGLPNSIAFGNVIFATWRYYGNRSGQILITANQIAKVADGGNATQYKLNTVSYAVNRNNVTLGTNLNRADALSAIPAKDTEVVVTPYVKAGGTTYFDMKPLADYATITGAVTRIVGQVAATDFTNYATINGTNYFKSQLVVNHPAMDVGGSGALFASQSYYVDEFGLLVKVTTAAPTVEYTYGVVTDSFIQKANALGGISSVAKVEILGVDNKKTVYDSVSLTTNVTLTDSNTDTKIDQLLAGTLVKFNAASQPAAVVVEPITGTAATALYYEKGTSRIALNSGTTPNTFVNADTTVFIQYDTGKWAAYKRANLATIGNTTGPVAAVTTTDFNNAKYIKDAETVAAGDTLTVLYLDKVSALVNLPATTSGVTGIVKGASVTKNADDTDVLTLELWTKDGIVNIYSDNAVGGQINLADYPVGMIINEVPLSNGAAPIATIKASRATLTQVPDAASATGLYEDTYYVGNAKFNEGGVIILLTNQAKGTTATITDMDSDSAVYTLTADGVTVGKLADLPKADVDDKVTLYACRTDADTIVFWYKADGFGDVSVGNGYSEPFIDDAVTAMLLSGGDSFVLAQSGLALVEAAVTTAKLNTAFATNYLSVAATKAEIHDMAVVALAGFPGCTVTETYGGTTIAGGATGVTVTFSVTYSGSTATGTAITFNIAATEAASLATIKTAIEDEVEGTGATGDAMDATVLTVTTPAVTKVGDVIKAESNVSNTPPMAVPADANGYDVSKPGGGGSMIGCLEKNIAAGGGKQKIIIMGFDVGEFITSLGLDSMTQNLIIMEKNPALGAMDKQNGTNAAMKQVMAGDYKTIAFVAGKTNLATADVAFMLIQDTTVEFNVYIGGASAVNADGTVTTGADCVLVGTMVFNGDGLVFEGD